MSLEAFDRWNEKKKITHQKQKIPYFYAGEIWWAHLGKNISSESVGKGEDFLRPVIILQKFYGKSAVVIPLTSQRKKGKYYFFFTDSKGIKQTAIIPQIRYVDGKRLKYLISKIPIELLLEIQEKLFLLIKNNPPPQK